jgi:DNA-binding transcriptional ArsR family regulator
LTAILGKRQPYVSQQLATLREAGLVVGRRAGTLVYYRLASESLLQLLDQGKVAVSELFGEDAAFPELQDEGLADCPCPRCMAN